MSVITRPSLLTCQDGHDYPALRSRGYEAMWYQHVNVANQGAGPVIKYPYMDFGACRAAGMTACVWGVTYGINNRTDSLAFYRDGLAMGEQAVELGADALMVDAEDCWKNTAGNIAATQLLVGIREGGWTGPVHLTTLGPPDNPKTASNPNGNDHEFELDLFIKTGGGIFPQCYVNQHAGYSPRAAVDYYTALGVPRDRLNLMIWLDGRLTAQQWVDQLKLAGLGAQMSVFMAETGRPDEWPVLEQITNLQPTVPLSPADARASMTATALAWAAAASEGDGSGRITLARRLVQPATTDAVLSKPERLELKQTLDRMGVPL